MHGKELFAAINSTLNGISFVLLVTAYIFVRNRKYAAHGWTMSMAFLSSSVFLASYLYSKYQYPVETTGIPAGAFRTFYLLVLIPHVLLAVVMLPMILLTLWRAYNRQWVKHRKIARPTWFIWAYVSVTGVLIYFILYRWYPSLYPEAFAKSELFFRSRG